MSKMGQELEDRLDANKYEMYGALQAVAYTMKVDQDELRDHPVTASMVREVLAKIDGGK